MKIITILFLHLLLASAAFGQLTREDLRSIIKEEVRPIIKEEIYASEKRMKEYIDLKIETVNAKIETVNAKIDAVEKSLNARIDATNTRIDALNTRLDDADSKFNRIWLAIIALITAAVALPQWIILYAERRRERELQTLLQQLREKPEGTETGANS